jgi:hypothetical protein
VTTTDIELEPAGSTEAADEQAGPSDEEMAAEVAEVMRESLESAGDLQHYPDGSRFLPQPGPDWDEPEPEGYAAVLVPADETRPCIRIVLPHLATGSYRDELDRHVGGSAESLQCDRDALVYVAEHSARDYAPNARVTRYVWGHSEAAAHNERADPDRPDYWLHGTVVIIGGAGPDAPPADVPRRLLAHFHVDKDRAE